MRHLVFYSGGLASWRVAYDLHKQGKDTHVLFTDTYLEDRDLYRFILEGFQILYGADLSFELGLIKDLPEPYEDLRRRKEILHQVSITVMASCNKVTWIGDNGQDVWDQFYNAKFLGNSRIAPCSKFIKQELAAAVLKDKYSSDDTVLYLGIGWAEAHRAKAPKANYAPFQVEMPLINEPYYTNEDHIALLDSLGVTVPRLYLQQFSHNNCGGFCVRGGQGHFKNLLEKNPKLYAYHEARERESSWIGVRSLTRFYASKLIKKITT